MSEEKKRKIGQIGTNDSSTSSKAPKHISIEEDGQKEEDIDPLSLSTLKCRNKAYLVEMAEKNKLIVFLKEKCNQMYTDQVISDSSFRCIRRHWLQLLGDCKLIMQQGGNTSLGEFESLNNILSATDPFNSASLMNLALSKVIPPDWFLIELSRKQEDAGNSKCTSTSKGKKSEKLNVVKVVDDEEMGNYFKIPEKIDLEINEEYRVIKEVLSKLFQSSVSSAKISESKNDESNIIQLLAENRAIRMELLQVKDNLEVSKRDCKRLLLDVELKEKERHSWARDYQRLLYNSDGQGGQYNRNQHQQGMGFLKEDIKMEIVAEQQSKTSQNISKHGSNSGGHCEDDHQIMKKQIEKMEKERIVLEDKIKNQSSEIYKLQQIRGDLETKNKNLLFEIDEHSFAKKSLEEKNDSLVRSLDKYRSSIQQLQDSVSNMEKKLTSKWGDKFTESQQNLAEMKAKFDETLLKYTLLKEKFAHYTSCKTQLSEHKLLVKTLQTQLKGLQNQADRAFKKGKETQKHDDKAELEVLQLKVSALEKITSGNNSNLDQDKLTSLEVETTQLKHQVNKLEELNQELSNEANSLVQEIEAISKELETVQGHHSRLLKKLEEKETSKRKAVSSYTQVMKSKTHLEEELSGVRLVLATCQEQLSLANEKTTEKPVDMMLISCLQSTNKTQLAEKRELESQKRVDAIRIRSLEQTQQKLNHDFQQLKNNQNLAINEQEMQKKKEKNCQQCLAYEKEKNEKQVQLQQARASGEMDEPLSELDYFELKDLRKLMKCSVCQDGQKNVILTKCFHMFCKNCIDENLKVRNRKCPTCKKMFGQDDVRNVWIS